MTSSNSKSPKSTVIYMPGTRGFLILILLTIAGVIGNKFSIPLFFGVDIIFGSIAVLLSIYLYGAFWGLLVCGITASYTILLWGHPYALIVFSFEGLFMVYYLRVKNKPILIYGNILFWMFAGMPASYFLYRFALGLPVQASLLIMFKQACNGIGNAIAASALLMIIPASFWHKIGTPQAQKISAKPGIGPLFTIILAGLILIPLLFSVVTMNRVEASRIEAKALEYSQDEIKRAAQLTDFFLDHQMILMKTYRILIEKKFNIRPPLGNFESLTIVSRDSSHPLVTFSDNPSAPVIPDVLINQLVTAGKDRFFDADCLVEGKKISYLGLFTPGDLNSGIIGLISKKNIHQIYNESQHEGIHIAFSSKGKTADVSKDLYPHEFKGKKGNYLEIAPKGSLPEMVRWQQAKWHSYKRLRQNQNWYVHVAVSYDIFLAGLQITIYRNFMIGMVTVFVFLLGLPYFTRFFVTPLTVLTDFSLKYTRNRDRSDGMKFPDATIFEIDTLSKTIQQMVHSIEMEESQRKMISENLSVSEQNLNDLLQLSKDAIISCNEDMIITRFNKGAENIFGYTPDKVIGQPLSLLIPERFHKIHPGHFSHFIKSSVTSKAMGSRKAVFGLTREGKEFSADITISKLETSSGIILTAIVRNVSKRADKETRLQMQSTLLAELARKDVVIGNNSLAAIHEITEAVTGAFDITRASVWLFDLSQETLLCSDLYEVSSNSHLYDLELSQDNFPIYFEAVKKGVPLGIDSARTDSITQEFMESYLVPNDIYAMLDVPIFIGGKTIGVLCIEQTGRERKWLVDEITFAGSLAILISLSIESAERAQSQSNLQLIKDELVQFVDTANAPIFGIDSDGKVNEWNQAAERITEYTKDDVMGRDLVRNFITDNYKKSVKQVLDKALTGEQTDNYELPLFTKSGARVMVLLNATTRRDAGDNIVGVVGVGQDITELSEYRDNLESIVELKTKELNQSLIETEQARDRIDGILKSVADGLIVTDNYNRVILMNRAAEDLLGIRFSEVVDRPIDFAIKEKHLRDKVKETLLVKKAGQTFDFELPSLNEDKPLIMRARTSIIMNSLGKDSGIVTIIQDVTHEREVDRMKTEFISTAAHELRTPLTSIRGFSEILLTRDNLKPEQKITYLGYINDQSEKLSAIINDLLDISRIESGRGFTLNYETYIVAESLRNIETYFKGLSSDHILDVQVKDDTFKLFADREKIDQVLKNLISNAIKYSPDGGLIQVSGQVVGKFYQSTVSDEGMGMTEKQVEMIFDKFYRVDSSDSAAEGTGLGMTIVKHSIEAHNGTIQVESKPDRGTKVTFCLPIDAPPPKKITANGKGISG